MFIENTKEDYGKSDITHIIQGEERVFDTSLTSRIVIPAYGAFFLESLKVYDTTTKLPLNANVDFKASTIDELATLKSGKSVVLFFVLTNPNIKGITYSYHFVGGQHSNGKYLMDEIYRLYPDGLDFKHWFENIQGRPDTYKSKQHKHSVFGTYGYDGVNRELDRIIDSAVNGVEENSKFILNQANETLDTLEDEQDTAFNQADIDLTAAFEILRVQPEEYIFTDSIENPSVKRGYGTWVRVTNTILRGADSALNIGDGTVINTGTQQKLRNCYIWKNTTAVSPTYTLSVDPALMYNGSAQASEGVDLVVTLQTTGIAIGTSIPWVVSALGNYLDEPAGAFIIDSNGRGTATLKFKDNPTVLGTRYTTLRLENVFGVSLPITVLDTIRTRWIELGFFYDIGATLKATQINEGTLVYLRAIFHGYEVGETAFLDWSGSNVLESDFEIKPLSYVSATATPLMTQVKLKKNQLTDGLRSLVVYAKDSEAEATSSVHPFAVVTVTDSSPSYDVRIEFDDVTSARTLTGDEGQAFDVKIYSNIFNGTIDLAISSTKPLTEFSSLPTTVTTNAGGYAEFRVTVKKDYLTNPGVQLFKVAAIYKSEELSDNQYIIKDTSQTPNYTFTITAPNSTTPITKVNEGSEFWIRLKVAGWVEEPTYPEIIFGYGLEGNYTATSGVTARVSGSYHNRLPFSSAAAVYNDVVWSNGELIIKMTAIADRKFSGNTIFNVSMKQANMDTVLLQTSVQIMDTSVLDMTATWSSSATVLSPITSVNEMQTNGTNNICYLWMDVDGDGSLFNDITLNVLANGTAVQADLATIFPTTVRFANGASRHVFTLILHSDFLTEGVETLSVQATYVDVNGNNAEIYRTSITVNDNSFVMPLTVQFSTSATDATAAPVGGKFSEFNKFYAHISFNAFAFTTTINWQIMNNALSAQATGQFNVLSGSVSVAAGVSKVVVEIFPVIDRVTDGEYIAKLKVDRLYPAKANQVIGVNAGQAFTLLDDSVEMKINTLFYKDAARTQLATIFNEGDTVYGRTTVTDPSGSFYLMNNFKNEVNVDSGGYTYLGGLNTSQITYTQQRMVRATYTPTAAAVSYTSDFSFVAKRNRATQSLPQLVEVGGVLVQNTSPAYAVGNTAAVIYDQLALTSFKKLTINDTSKTPVYVGKVSLTANGASVANVNEGVTFYLSLNITDGEVGDVYTVQKTNGFDANRFETNQLGIDQIQSIANDNLNWVFKVAIDRKTNTGNQIQFTIVNKTTGANVAVVTVDINDIYRTPVLTAKYYNLNAGVWGEVGFPVEGQPSGTQYLMIIYGDSYLLTDETITLNRLSGRAASKYDPVVNLGKAYQVQSLASNGLVPPALRGYNGVVIPIYPNEDMLTNTATDLQMSLRATTSLSGGSVDYVKTIMDTSMTRAITSIGWYNSGGTNISSIDEGQTAILKVVTSGGVNPYNIVVLNNGGRSIGRLTAHEYSVSKSRSSDSQVLQWSFTPSNDFTNNTGAETKLAVTVLDQNGGKFTRNIELPINDTSMATTGSIEIYTAGTTTQITKIGEGASFDLAFKLNQPNTANVFRVLAKSNRASDGWALDSNVNGTSFTNLGSNNYQYKVNGKSTSLDAATTPADKLYIDFELWDVTANRLLATKQLTLVDVSRETIASSNIRITSPSDANKAHIATVNEGQTVRLYFAPVCFANTVWTNRRFYWAISIGSNNGITPLNGYISQANLAADGSYSINVAIGANEQTDGNRLIGVSLFEVFDDIGSKMIRRGDSATTIIIDTSKYPQITDVRFTRDASGNKPLSSLNAVYPCEFYIVVEGTGLRNDTSAATVNLTWSTGVQAALFNPPLAATMSVPLVDSVNRLYKGIAKYNILEGLTDVTKTGLIHGGYAGDWSTTGQETSRTYTINSEGTISATAVNLGNNLLGGGGGAVRDLGIFYTGYSTTTGNYNIFGGLQNNTKRINAARSLLSQEIYSGVGDARGDCGSASMNNVVGVYAGHASWYAYNPPLNKFNRINYYGTMVEATTTIGTARHFASGCGYDEVGIFYGGRLNYDSTGFTNIITRIDIRGNLASSETAVGTKRQFVHMARVNDRIILNGHGQYNMEGPQYPTANIISAINKNGAMVITERNLSSNRVERGVGLSLNGLACLVGGREVATNRQNLIQAVNYDLTNLSSVSSTLGSTPYRIPVMSQGAALP